MRSRIFRFLAIGALFCAAATHLFAAATLTIVNANDAGVGFNDPTPATPIGGNPGTTIGEQRLNAFRHAANIWGALLDSSVEIRIQASFVPLSCTANSGVLGSAGTIQVFRDFSGALYPGTWYPVALANKRAGVDLAPGEPRTNADDIRARFNVNIGQPDCLSATSWYYGLDTNHGNRINLVNVILHEFGHGLGFLTLVNLETGTEFMGRADIFERGILDNSAGKRWHEMSNEERIASIVNVRRVVWDGPITAAVAPGVLRPGTPALVVHSPGSLARDYAVGEANFGPRLTSAGIPGTLVQALDVEDAAGPTNSDACSPLTNAAAVSGKIALVDRGTCTFVTKVRNAQNAGAIAVIVADNAEGSPPAGLGGDDPTAAIPSVRVSQPDGASLRGGLSAGVTLTLRVNAGQFSGADATGRLLLNATIPVTAGSSINHWDPIASPNLLMEPTDSSDLMQGVDLTLPLFRDLGWVANGDSDADSILDAADNCPAAFNPRQEDFNRNGVGDACERDSLQRTSRPLNPRLLSSRP